MFTIDGTIELVRGRRRGEFNSLGHVLQQRGEELGRVLLGSDPKQVRDF